MITAHRLGPPRHLPDRKEYYDAFPNSGPNKKSYYVEHRHGPPGISPYSTRMQIREDDPEIDAKLHLPGA